MAFNQFELKDFLEIKREEDAIQLRVQDLCRIDLSQLEEALSRHPALIGYAAAMFEVAEVAEAKAKWELEMAKAQAIEEASAALGPKATVAAIDSKAKLTLSVRRATDDFHEKKLITGRLKALVKGLDHRKDMLVQISARQRSADRY